MPFAFFLSRNVERINRLSALTIQRRQVSLFIGQFRSRNSLANSTTRSADGRDFQSVFPDQCRVKGRAAPVNTIRSELRYSFVPAKTFQSAEFLPCSLRLITGRHRVANRSCFRDAFSM